MATIKKNIVKKAVPSKTTPKKASTIVSKSEPSKKTQMPTAIFNIDEINQLIHAVNHSNVNELKLEKGDFKITIRQGLQQIAPVASAIPAVVHTAAPSVVASPSQTAPSAPAPAAAQESTDNLITIKSPMIGTFYRSAGPDKPPFVNVGDQIEIGQVLCIVEAMKLFNEIESEFSGKIVKVLIDDASPVEYDQPLFLLQP
ncbi:MAG: acetyl-CoA carboxylase biotin carboxyl carrier protein [Chitinophagaceae bacterium]